jgi:hypothetical protein
LVSQYLSKQKDVLISLAIPIGASVVVFVGWLSILILGFNHWDRDDLQLWGTFGDSFGVIAAFFSGLAFISAAFAVVWQWKAERKNAVEGRFFQLLNSLQTAVNATRVGKREGRQAIRSLAESLTKRQFGNRRRPEAGTAYSLDQRRQDIGKWFDAFYDGYESNGKKHYPAGDRLGHIFRLTYHILKYLHDNKEVGPDEKTFYVRILRAHLSNPELLLIFYNAFGREGKPFFPLIEEHDLLQNIIVTSLPDLQDALLYKTLEHRVPPAG